MTRVLENNLNPATHFIEQWRDKKRKKPIYNADCNPIEILPSALINTRQVDGKTIAIFKIRMKPQ